jgi:hypothetical protein
MTLPLEPPTHSVSSCQWHQQALSLVAALALQIFPPKWPRTLLWISNDLSLIVQSATAAHSALLFAIESDPPPMLQYPSSGLWMSHRQRNTSAVKLKVLYIKYIKKLN